MCMHGANCLLAMQCSTQLGQHQVANQHSPVRLATALLQNQLCALNTEGHSLSTKAPLHTPLCASPEEAGHGAAPDVLCHDANDRVVSCTLRHHTVEPEHLHKQHKTQKAVSTLHGRLGCAVPPQVKNGCWRLLTTIRTYSQAVTLGSSSVTALLDSTLRNQCRSIA